MSILNHMSNFEAKKIKALAVDLDGTVLARGAMLSERTARTIKLCVERGLRVILCTGRAIEAAEPYRSAFGATGPMVYYNGAVVLDTPENKILKTALMDKTATGVCVDIARDMGVHCQLYVLNEVNPAGGNRIPLLTERDTPEREMYHKHTGILAELVDLKEVLASPDLQGCVKAMFLAEPEVLAEVRSRLERHFGDSAYIARTANTFLEVLDPKASKGLGLKFVMEQFSLKKEEMIAFGDEENDIPMFKVCGCSAATANAKDNVKAVANIVIGSNADDGVAAFLEEFLIPGKR